MDDEDPPAAAANTILARTASRGQLVAAVARWRSLKASPGLRITFAGGRPRFPFPIPLSIHGIYWKDFANAVLGRREVVGRFLCTQDSSVLGQSDDQVQLVRQSSNLTFRQAVEIPAGSLHGLSGTHKDTEHLHEYLMPFP